MPLNACHSKAAFREQDAEAEGATNCKLLPLLLLFLPMPPIPAYYQLPPLLISV
jgi:hypothetical protein